MTPSPSCMRRAYQRDHAPVGDPVPSRLRSGSSPGRRATPRAPGLTLRPGARGPPSRTSTLPTAAGGVAATPAIVVTAVDFDRLQQLVGGATGPAAEQLDAELARARIVSPDELTPDVVAMNSDVTYEDLTARPRRTVRVVYPRDAAPARGRVSALAPLGAALLGACASARRSTGSMPRGVHRVRVVAVAHAAT
ncbi:MAG: GreA/GreB family elongation factor [Kofleriaceae bacterium]|nr:GreA/GreB family elongation factor [Kofleriaceae bacterium]